MPTSPNLPAADSAKLKRSPQTAAVADVAKNSGVPEEVVRTFARIAAPENSAVFSDASAVKAFADVKVERS